MFYPIWVVKKNFLDATGGLTDSDFYRLVSLYRGVAKGTHQKS